MKNKSEAKSSQYYTLFLKNYVGFLWIHDDYFVIFQKCCLFCTEKTTFLLEMKISKKYASVPWLERTLVIHSKSPLFDFSFFGRVAWLCKNWPKHVLIAAESLNYSWLWSLKSYLQNSFSTWCMSSSTCTYEDFTKNCLKWQTLAYSELQPTVAIHSANEKNLGQVPMISFFFRFLNIFITYNHINFLFNSSIVKFDNDVGKFSYLDMECPRGTRR